MKNFIKVPASFYTGLIVTAIVIIFQYIIGVSNKNSPIQELGVFPIPIVKKLSPSESLYVVNFFASWCGSCRKEHDLLLYLANQLQLPIYGIALNDNSGELSEFLTVQGNPYKKLITDIAIAELSELKIANIPRTFIVKNGKIIYDKSGPLNKLVIQQQVIPLINKIHEIK